MNVPLEIRFHQVEGSPQIESEIRQRVEKLTKLSDRLIACRVSVEAPHRQHKTGNLMSVHIEMSVPGRTLMVTQEPHKAKERYASPDLRTVLRNAFQTAERQLKEFRRMQRGEVKPHEEQFRGRITQLVPEKDHGFLMTAAGALLYFNRTSVLHENFDDLKVGERVHYVEIDGDDGPIASKVWRVLAS